VARTGATKAANGDLAVGRLRKAIAFQAAVDCISAYREEVNDVDVLTTLAILSAIAFTDAMTVVILGKINQQDHQSAPQLLRAALGKALPDAQHRRLVKLIGQKDQAAYGAGIGRGSPDEIVEILSRFAEFAIETLARYGVRR
jgi:hypothetical protein